MHGCLETPRGPHGNQHPLPLHLPRTKENGLDRDPLHPEHLSKRPCTMSPAQRYSPSNGLSHPPNGLPPPPGPPPQHYRLEDMAMAHHYRDTYRHADPRERPRPGELSSLLWVDVWGWEACGADFPPPQPHAWFAAVHGARQEEVIDHRLTDREWAEEWKHLNNVRRAPCPPPAPTVCPLWPFSPSVFCSHGPNPTPAPSIAASHPRCSPLQLLNCIMDMVEKTRRSLTVLRRCQEADREELNHWIRRYSDAEDMKKGSPPSARPHNSSSSSEAPQLGIGLGGCTLSGMLVPFPQHRVGTEGVAAANVSPPDVAPL